MTHSVSPSSSPPTPPSSPLLPISFAPGNQTYTFTPSPSPSPPFSLSPSTDDNLLPRITSAFSLDRPVPDPADSKSSCLRDLLHWIIRRCCQCFSLFQNSSSTLNRHEQ
ncbi:hypothetical protein LINGRAHAP2_LOCUS13631 [Linum grandiflorum]